MDRRARELELLYRGSFWRFGAGLFVYGVPRANWEPGRLPMELQYLDADGNAVGEVHRLALIRLLELARR